MKLYIAHNWAARENLASFLIRQLERAGHEVTSRWIKDPSHEAGNEAQDDFMDVMRADALILFTNNFGERPGRGKYVEFGLALAMRIPVYLLGETDDCVFYRLPQVKRFHTVIELLAHLDRK